LGLLNNTASTETQNFIENVNLFFKSTSDLLFKYPFLPDSLKLRTIAWKQHLKQLDSIFNIGSSLLLHNEGIGNINLLNYINKQTSITKEEKVMLAVDVLTAGVDTTTRAILFLIYNIALDKEIQIKIRAEINQYSGNGPINSKAISNMKYLNSCLKESMRLFPIVPTQNRKIVDDLEFDG